MCGIFATAGVADAGLNIFNSLKNLEYRGYDSWGIAVLFKDSIQITKATGFLPAEPPRLPLAQCGIGHTRWATHGGVTTANAHPHLSCNGHLAIVHNGIVENYLALKSHLKNSHSFRSQTDTEILVHYLEEILENSSLNLVNAVKKVSQLITGLNAFVVLDRQTGDIVAYRQGSPLTLGKRGKTFFLSSDLPTLSQLATHVSPLQDGQIVNLSDLPKSIQWTQASLNHKKSIQLKTKYHMESEIKECYKLSQNNNHFTKAQLSLCASAIKQADHIILTGCGSSYHACLFGQHQLNAAGYSAQSCIASDASHLLSLIGNKTLVIALSQSGETIDTVEFVKNVKARGGKTLCLTNVPLSTLDQMCDLHLYLNVGVEVAVASTKAFVAMIKAFSVILNRTQSTQSFNPLKNLLLPEETQHITALARQIMHLKHLYILGSGLYYPLALECALKFKEIGYLHAEAVLTGELKHGPLALLTQSTTCLLLGKTKDLNITAREIQSRGAHVISIEVDDDCLSRILYVIIFCYLLSYYHAVYLGHNPDRPRHLAKSVTVK